MSYDRYGNLQQMVFFDKDGRLVTQRALGAAIRTIGYDDEGNIVENTFETQTKTCNRSIRLCKAEDTMG